MALLQKGYLGATPLWRDIAWFQIGWQKIISESSSVTVTADTSAHVKGSWVELIASTSGNASVLLCEATNVSANGVNTATLLDIGTGASGSETPLISNVGIGGASSIFTWPVPIKIASGTRLSARIQSVVTGGKTASISVRALDADNYSDAPASVDVIGSSTATSAGTTFSGASGTFVEVIASTTKAYRAVVLIPSVSGSATSAVSFLKLTLARGASGAEVEVGTIITTYSNQEAVNSAVSRWPYLIGGPIPSGTRLSVQHELPSSGQAPNHAVTLIGIP